MDIKFLHYLRYRSFGLLSLLTLIILYTREISFVILLIIFIVHTYYIYRREDKGINHYQIIKKLNEVEGHINHNQVEMIKLLKKINATIKK